MKQDRDVHAYVVLYDAGEQASDVDAVDEKTLEMALAHPCSAEARPRGNINRASEMQGLEEIACLWDMFFSTIGSHETNFGGKETHSLHWPPQPKAAGVGVYSTTVRKALHDWGAVQ